MNNMKSKIICVKCKKGIRCSAGYYNYPSGPMHIKCGKEKSKIIQKAWDEHGLMYAISIA